MKTDKKNTEFSKMITTCENESFFYVFNINLFFRLK